MKFNVVKTIIAIAASLLIAYAMYAYDKSGNGWLLPIVTFIESAVLLTCALGIKFEWLRTMANIKIASWGFFMICLVMNVIFSGKPFSVPAFIISNGAVFLVVSLIIYSLTKANKDYPH